MARVKIKIEGMEKLLKDLKRLEKVPQKHVTAAAKKGMTIALKQARADAPEETGALKRGIILYGEKSRRRRAKKVYRVVFDSRMNYAFQKPVQDPGSRGGKGQNPAYYPISQEYGYFAGKGNYIPGYRFISDALPENARGIERTIIKVMQKKIDVEIAKAGLR